MMKFLDEMDTTCKVIGAVNTVSNDNGRLKGYNTDMIGFLDPIKKRNLNSKKFSSNAFGCGWSCKSNCNSYG